jgi:hypothetical protein
MVRRFKEKVRNPTTLPLPPSPPPILMPFLFGPDIDFDYPLLPYHRAREV